jgi:uncharacterized protein YecE (DUF72 family)
MFHCQEVFGIKPRYCHIITLKGNSGMPGQARIYIGTSGWSYPKGDGTWTGYFYPIGKINEWQKFTHPKMYKEATGKEAIISQEDVDQFKNSIEPLARYGKLGALLAQFPPSFKNDSFGQQILSAVISTFGHYRLAVELRHRSWSDDENTATFLREKGVSWVQIDEPKFQSSVAAEVPITADMAYFRFHGRNKEMWWKGDSETRYKYLYSSSEINELAEKVKSTSERANLSFVLFNNHWQGYAPRNAIDMKKALQLPFTELPLQIPIEEDESTESV